MSYKLIERNGEMIYGKHLLLTANSCNEKIHDMGSIVNFVSTLVKKINMKPFGDPIAHKIDTDTPFGGISVVQIIRTSTITIHTYDDFRDFYLDVFSCTDYDENEVLDYVAEYFNPDKIKHQVIYRN